MGDHTGFDAVDPAAVWSGLASESGGQCTGDSAGHFGYHAAGDAGNFSGTVMVFVGVGDGGSGLVFATSGSAALFYDFYRTSPYMGRGSRRCWRLVVDPAIANASAHDGFTFVNTGVVMASTAAPVGQFELLASDIGQGSAVLVRTAKHALLYDAGPRFSATSDAGDRVLVPLLRALGVSLDRVVLSHRDSDHVGGALAVLGVHRQADLLSSIEDDHELQTVRPATRCMAGQQWRWDGVAFEVLHPRNSDYAMGLSPNAMSCVLRISNGVVTALLTGDIPRAQEARLLNDGAQLLANVLLVPHHGSKTSSSSAFLDAVQPQIALVQAGYRNHFGHPAEPVLVRYAERSIVIVDSPHCGAATWQSWQPRIALCQRLQVLRYWHHRLPCH